MAKGQPGQCVPRDNLVQVALRRAISVAPSCVNQHGASGAAVCADPPLQADVRHQHC